MQNLYIQLEDLLKNNDRYAVDGKLLKNLVVENALKLDKDFLKLLVSNSLIKRHFFEEIEGFLIFDKIKFIHFVDNKQFLPDSYTSFRNKIGLMLDDKYISESKEVNLAWPYKDCILEGGQTKEEESRNEIFWNDILAPDEIDRLLAPKVLTNFIKYDKHGKKKLDKTVDFIHENLVIKGNNLLAMHTLAERFSNQIKLIYIDPPYNIGNDSFLYNDNFKHSTWLTFMKNRLEIAHKLLRTDGCIFIQIDHHEIAYLSVLMDQIFGVNNKVQIIAVKVASPSGFKAVNPGPIDVTEYILFYTKNKKEFEFVRNYISANYHKNYNLYLEKNSQLKNWKLVPLKERVLKDNGFSNEKEFKKKYHNFSEVILQELTAEYAFNNAENVVSIRDLHKPSDKLKKLQDESRRKLDVIIPYKRQDGEYTYLINGGVLAFYSTKIRAIDNKPQVTELLSNFWDHISWAGIAKEGGVKLKNGKKPEKLIKQIIEISGAQKGDIVLDFFSGSGTTCATAHKMGMQYIGIEQIEYDENDMVVRLNNVIEGDTTGISKLINWKGGGSFICCELAELNSIYLKKILAAKTSGDLLRVWKEIVDTGYIVYKTNIDEFNSSINTFKSLDVKSQKKILTDILDKNMLYVNYTEINDKDYNIKAEVIQLNNIFYNSK